MSFWSEQVLSGLVGRFKVRIILPEMGAMARHSDIDPLHSVVSQSYCARGFGNFLKQHQVAKSFITFCQVLRNIEYLSARIFFSDDETGCSASALTCSFLKPIGFSSWAIDSDRTDKFCCKSCFDDFPVHYVCSKISKKQRLNHQKYYRKKVVLDYVALKVFNFDFISVRIISCGILLHFKI
jgi:hypothetical protein